MQSLHKKSNHKESNFLVFFRNWIFNVICFLCLSPFLKCIHQHSFQVKVLARGIVKLRFHFRCKHIVAALFLLRRFFWKQLPNNAEKNARLAITVSINSRKSAHIAFYSTLLSFCVNFPSPLHSLAGYICLLNRRRTKNRAMHLSVHFVCCARPIGVVAYLSEFS